MVGFLPKLNNTKLVALIITIVHAVMIFFSIVGMAGIGSDYPGYDLMSDKGKAYRQRDGILLFGSSVSGR